MPANNRRPLNDSELQTLNAKYKISYIEHTQDIMVELTTCKRKTVHHLDDWFSINSRTNPKRKIVFSKDVITFWIDFQANNDLKKYTIFDVQNAYTTLKVLYQPVTKQSIIELLKHKFDGIKRI